MKTYDTPESRAARILAINGKARAILSRMNEKEIAALAALVNEKGEAVDGAAEMYASVLRAHYDRFKATDADSEKPTVDVAAQQKVRDEAAAIVANKGEPAPAPTKAAKAPTAKPEAKEGE